MYFNAYPGVKRYIQESHNMALYNHFVWTPFGQRKQEYNTYPCFKRTASYNAALRNAQNVRIQSTTSTLGLITFSHLNEAVKKINSNCKCTCTVYDSIELEVPLQYASEVIETGFYYMNDWPQEYFKWLDIPIGVEGEIGTSWGDLEVVHRGVTQAEVEAMLSRKINS